jgi:hypothetical protein
MRERFATSEAIVGVSVSIRRMALECCEPNGTAACGPGDMIGFKIELTRIVEHVVDIADPLGPRNQAFGSEPDADGLFRHPQKLGEGRGEPFCLVRRDWRGSQAEFTYFAQS